jgi:hypothetical protein
MFTTLKEELTVTAIDRCKIALDMGDIENAKSWLHEAKQMADEVLKDRKEWEEGGCP